MCAFVFFPNEPYYSNACQCTQQSHHMSDRNQDEAPIFPRSWCDRWGTATKCNHHVSEIRWAVLDWVSWLQYIRKAVFIYIYMPIEPKWPLLWLEKSLFLGVDLPKIEIIGVPGIYDGYIYHSQCKTPNTTFEAPNKFHFHRSLWTFSVCYLHPGPGAFTVPGAACAVALSDVFIGSSISPVTSA